jgi:CheY-like chemotaxis protein
VDETIRVMVVDDEPIVGHRLRAALERSGFVVEVFENGAAAAARIAAWAPDVLVTDVRMPGLDGLALIDRVRQLGLATKVVLITAFATPELARDAIGRGASECIAKPFRIAELRSAVERAAARAREG